MRIPGFADLSPWNVVKQAVKSFIDDDMVTYAAALSYHLTLALFPFVIFLLTLLGALGLSEFFDRLLRQAQTALPPDAYELLARFLHSSYRSGHGRSRCRDADDGGDHAHPGFCGSISVGRGQAGCQGLPRR